MKKNLLYILAILAITGMWSSCSDNDGGEDEPEMPLTAPEVSVQNLSLKNAILPAKAVRLRVNIINTTHADLQWFVEGKATSTDTIYEFSSATEGEYKIKVTASNILGEASDSTYITVQDGFKISDVTNWTGEGECRSVLAIQWVKPEVEDLLHPTDEDVFFRAWGYKWNKPQKGKIPPTGFDMIKAIAKSEPRLFVIVSSDALGTTIKGFGYDGNGDGKISIESDDFEHDKREYKGISLTEADFTDGIYVQKQEDNIDDVRVTSEGDWWMGGWYVAYASYWLGYGEAVLEAEEYEYSNFYASNRELEDECWDAWTFSPINDAEQNILPIPRLLKAAGIK